MINSDINNIFLSFNDFDNDNNSNSDDSIINFLKKNEFLSNKHTINSLDFSYKSFNEETFNNLCDILKKNKKINMIDFSNCFIPINLSSKLIDILDFNKTLININMNNNNSISDINKEKIQIKLSINVIY